MKSFPQWKARARAFQRKPAIASPSTSPTRQQTVIIPPTSVPIKRQTPVISPARTQFPRKPIIQKKQFPLALEYQEAFENLSTHMLDPSIKNGRVALSKYGLPEPMSGRFACVFKVSQRNNIYAVKCFVSSSAIDIQKRYGLISAFLRSHKFPFFVNFTYVSNGIPVRGQKYPILKMEWARGENLVKFIDMNLTNKILLKNAARELVQCVARMQFDKAAHGDLQHDNIKVAINPQSKFPSIFLVDYDGMYIPSFAGTRSPELGLRNYQHPKRTENDYNENLDNFSTLVIYLSMLAVAADSGLWKHYHDDEDFLIFKENDFAAPEQSELIKDLLRNPSITIRNLTNLLVEAIDSDPLSEKTCPNRILAM